MKKLVLLILISNIVFSCRKEKVEKISDSQVLEFPIVFHIIHEGAAVGVGDNIPSTVIQYELNRLNTVFAASSTNIRFRLATKKPNYASMTEPGIDRINGGVASYDYSTLISNPTFFKSYVWDPNSYINVFIADITNPQVGGWTTLPFNQSGYKGLTGLPSINSNDFGSSSDIQSIILIKNFEVFYANINISQYNSIAHEMGHQFGLGHIFQTACSSNGDYCGDTNFYSSSTNPNQQSTFSRTSCKGVNFNSNNVMDYTPLHTTYTFTPDQIKRMRHVCNYSPFRRETWKSTK